MGLWLSNIAHLSSRGLLPLVAAVRNIELTPTTVELAQEHFPIFTTRKVMVSR